MDGSFYSGLQEGLQSLGDSEKVGSSGMDDFLGNTVRVASLDDLFNFVRIGTDTLVHKAERDLWRINEDKKGQIVIERLFDPSSNQAIRV